ncbi:hypothetical protein PHYSODRAFT_330316 [Phytophthora sojae]|uniref:Uncharacterized protein n=1 Tax=Phytophthora sojae (strain P6497) TaxID=1094619 RepID=G4Z8J5_PHYSP|nr:hypothetical protein PHYSODRAFT_330316 [Phytophthora sojae]EGZ22546.1 hypothetical protein PHYSODRAFT_330316 [Phytophthora sojae]|eukprot:XP_009525263.1 hypothetical protein PHYSODRAFT_330316 [Phytophthora sojae]
MSSALLPSNWALANFLRSDSHYNRYQFSKSVEVAATRNDLGTLKWLFAHFAGCQLPKEVAAAAATHGNVPMLQFLWENDAGRLDRGESTSNNRQEMEASVGTTEGLIYSGNVVDWRFVLTTAQMSLERDRENAIIRALQSGDEELAKVLIPSGRCVLDYAASMIQKLAGAGRLDFMQQIVLLHSPLPEGEESFCHEAWHSAMVAASWTGRMATLKWLVEHPMGQPICDYMKSRRNLVSFVCIAGNQDQLEREGLSAAVPKLSSTDLGFSCYSMDTLTALAGIRSSGDVDTIETCSAARGLRSRDACRTSHGRRAYAHLLLGAQKPSCASGDLVSDELKNATRTFRRRAAACCCCTWIS